MSVNIYKHLSYPYCMQVSWKENNPYEWFHYPPFSAQEAVDKLFQHTNESGEPANESQGNF